MFFLEIYNREWELLDKIYEFGDFTVRKNINSDGFFQFTIQIENANEEIIKRTNFVKLYKTRDNSEYLVFEGMIDVLQGGISFMTVFCTDLIGYFQYKFAINEYGEINRLANAYLDTVITELNNDEEIGITIGENLITDNTRFATQKKETILNFIKRLANSVDSEFEILDKKINLKKNVGEDKTGEIQLIYDKDNPSTTNISEPQFESNLKNYANWLFVEGNGISTIVFDSNEIYNKGYGKIKKYIRETNISDLTALQNYANSILEKTIKDLSVRDLKVQGLKIEDVGIGDLVYLQIKTGNKINSFEGITRVMGITLDVKNTYENVDLILSENIKSIDQSFIGRIRELGDRVDEIYRNF